MSYENLPQDQRETLIDLRDRLYEDHGCISHNSETKVLINLFYHLMYEISIATDELDEGWGESEAFVQRHKELVKLLDYQRPEHPYDD